MQCILLYNQIKTADDMCNFKSDIISSGATRGHLGKKKNQNPHSANWVPRAAELACDMLKSVK